MIYPLFGVTDGRLLIVSRGETEFQVLDYIVQSGTFPRGVTLYSAKALPITAAKEYLRNHDEGWLYRCPKYLEVKS